MIENNLRFEQACCNMAGFIWGSWAYEGYKSKEDLWQALPEATKQQIRDFILAPKENPNRKLYD